MIRVLDDTSVAITIVANGPMANTVVARISGPLMSTAAIVNIFTVGR